MDVNIWIFDNSTLENDGKKTLKKNDGKKGQNAIKWGVHLFSAKIWIHFSTKLLHSFESKQLVLHDYTS